MNKTRKILSIILIFVLMFGRCLSVSASSYPTDRTEAYNKIYNYVIANDLPIEKYQIFKFYTDSTEYYYLYTSDFMPYYTSTGNGKFLLSLGNNESITFHRYEYKASTGDVIHSLHQVTSSTSDVMIGDSAGVSTLKTVYYNFDLIKYGESNVWVTSQYNDFFLELPTNNTYNNVTSGSILVTAEVGSTYSITLPATLALSKNEETGKYEGEYAVGVKANLTGNEAVTITPNSTVALTNEGGDSVDGAVLQSVNTWRLTASLENEITSDYTQFVETTGKVSADLQKSGTYSGSLNFTFAKVTD